MANVKLYIYIYIYIIYLFIYPAASAGDIIWVLHIITYVQVQYNCMFTNVLKCQVV